jgi:hypothetical protein
MTSSNSFNQSEITQQFQALRQQFHQGLPLRLDSLKQAHDPEVRHTLLHSLSGAAGLYGDAELCSLTQKAIHSLLQNQINSYEEMVTEISLNIEKIVQVDVINIS